MEGTIEGYINKYPKLAYLFKDPQFKTLSDTKKKYILELIEDAEFWIELNKKENSDDGFKFLASTFGLVNAQKEADEKGLKGEEREKFLKPHQDLYTQYNPYSGRTSDD